MLLSYNTIRRTTIRGLLCFIFLCEINLMFMNNYLQEDVFDHITLFLMHIVYAITYCLFALCCLKLVLFFLNKRKSWKLQHLLYFGQSHTMFSTSNKSYTHKRLQNILSKSIVVLLCIMIALKLMLAQTTGS